MTLTDRFLALTSTAFLLCCSGTVEPSAPATLAEAVPGVVPSPHRSTALTRVGEATPLPGEGRLEVSAGPSATTFLGSLHAVVTDAGGHVVAGADEDVADATAERDRTLALTVPAGAGYTLSLSATTSDQHPTTCHAAIAALAIAAGATARAQIFSWDCGEVTGYVPATLDGDCNWLADWSFIARTTVARGDVIDVSAAAHDPAGKPLTFTWSTASPDQGTFEHPDAASATFRCRAANENLPLTLRLAAADCVQQISQTVVCR